MPATLRTGARRARQAALALLMAGAATPCFAQDAGGQGRMAQPMRDAVKACKALDARGDRATAIRLARLPDAMTSITSAQIIPADGNGGVVEKGLPEICRVEGVISPSIGFLLRMPTKTWNGKFMMGGCGGPCGNYLSDRIDPALARNYAVVVTDMGHRGPGWQFGYRNLQGLIDFGYRSTHVTAIAAKAIIKEYYGRPAAFNYFWGCSTGGRQGMVEAQRFPDDFDGIAAGALPWTQVQYNGVVTIWGAKANTGKDGKPILTEDRRAVVHKAVLEACDGLDGLKDGVLQNPLACSWTANLIACKPGQSRSACLTPEEVRAVQLIYDGPLFNDKGARVYLGQGGRQRGSELKWTWDIEVSDGADLSQIKMDDIWGDRGADFDDRTWDPLKDTGRLMLVEPLFSATNPDLRNFKAGGGKLILYHGLDDAVPSGPTIDYYETATRVMGGPAQTNDFFRLFLLSGTDHCRYGIGGGEVDWISALENWVEKGQAPDQVTAYHMVSEPYPSEYRPLAEPAQTFTRMARHPLPAGSYDRAHPVYPYPDWPRYSGKGDPALPASWEKAPRP